MLHLVTFASVYYPSLSLQQFEKLTAVEPEGGGSKHSSNIRDILNKGFFVHGGGEPFGWSC